MLFVLRTKNSMPNKEPHVVQGFCVSKEAAKSLPQTCLLAIDQIDRGRPRDENEAGSSAAKKRPLMAMLHSAFVAGREVVEQHGILRDPVIEDGWGALTWTSAAVVDASISEWAADLFGGTFGERDPAGG